MFKLKILKLLFAAVVALALGTSSAKADLVLTGSGTVQSQPVSASVTFSIVGGNLQITLTNTASSTNAMAQVLTNLEWNWSGTAPTFTTGSGSASAATVAVGSTLYQPISNVNTPTTITNVSSQWSLGLGVAFAGETTSHQFGISATSWNNATSSSLLQTTTGNSTVDSQPFDGGDFGLTTSINTDGIKTHWIIGGSTVDGSGNTNNSSVVIMLDAGGTLTAADLANITSVEFSYGSEQDGVTGVSAVPEPSSIVLMGLGFVGLAGFATRLRRRQPIAA